MVHLMRTCASIARPTSQTPHIMITETLQSGERLWFTTMEPVQPHTWWLPSQASKEKASSMMRCMCWKRASLPTSWLMWLLIWWSKVRCQVGAKRTGSKAFYKRLAPTMWNWELRHPTGSEDSPSQPFVIQKKYEGFPSLSGIKARHCRYLVPVFAEICQEFRSPADQYSIHNHLCIQNLLKMYETLDASPMHPSPKSTKAFRKYLNTCLLHFSRLSVLTRSKGYCSGTQFPKPIWLATLGISSSTSTQSFTLAMEGKQWWASSVPLRILH